MTWLLLGVLLLSTNACAVRRWNLRTFPQCPDKLPVKILIHPACPPDGVCGYSCLPGRWREVLREAPLGRAIGAR